MQALQNEQALGKSHDDLNDMLAVFLRLFFSRMNQVIELQNRVYEIAVSEVPEDQRPENPDEHKIPLLEYDEVNELFKLFARFKLKPDYQTLFRAWYTGEDLGELPPLPEPEKPGEAKEEEKEEEVGTPADYEGAEVYGGDYGKSEDGNGTAEVEAQRAEEESSSQDSVPELRGSEDGGPNDPGDEEEGAVVPPVPA